MLYSLFRFLDEYDVPGSGMFQYISFRAAVAVILALLITILLGRPIIRFLQRHQIGEEIRNLGLEGEHSKKGTPTMGGLLILVAILIPTLLLGRLNNIYIQIMLISAVWLGGVGFIDDYIKTFRHNKAGLKPQFKVVGQVALGLIVGTMMWYSPDVVIHEKVSETTERLVVDEAGNQTIDEVQHVMMDPIASKSTKTTIPFVKNNEFDYGWFAGGYVDNTWLLYVVVAITLLLCVSNGANLADGLDGLLGSISIPIVVVLGALAYLSGHIIYADYLNIMYIPHSAELVVFAAAMVGALLGFLWYNSHPAQIFMGDTGSLAIGGIVALFAMCIRKELLLPLLCGLYFAEAISVVLQVGWFKYTKWRYGEGRRIFRMAPLHHHYQKAGIFETKIVQRFFIISILLCAITMMTLKIR
ncbi:MAG: phospho-N-acetylmuramoyl-pentapeptide-transferase [Alistipes sp.]|nr:phospho-N-acetylmuramoyl-pentapeptide-transferase [Alistipes sp.]